MGSIQIKGVYKVAGRPSKPTELILLEGKSHRTKEELDARKKLEALMYTGVHMKIWPEVKQDKIAHKEFNRVRALLMKIGKDDALQEGIVNRYALLKAECQDFEIKRETFYESIGEMKTEFQNQNIQIDPVTGKMEYALSPSQYYKLLATMQQSIVNLDKQIMAKRSMMLAIEKECLLTISSALRSIPKKPPKETKTGGVASFMQGRVQSG